VLRSGGVRFEEITPVLLEPTEMPPALAEGRIDAMAIWEPQPQVAIDRLGGMRLCSPIRRRMPTSSALA